MRDPTNLASDMTAAHSAEAGHVDDAATAGVPSDRRPFLPNFDFDNLDEESIKFLEEQWVRFCGAIGLTGDIPDLRAHLAAEREERQRRRSRWFVRPFFALYAWLKTHP